MKRSNKVYGVGCLIMCLGGAGLAENITSGRGSFMFCAVILSIGIATILVSYSIKDD